MTKRSWRLWAAACALAALPAFARAAAQDTVTVGAPVSVPSETVQGLPRELAERVVDFYNGARTIRLQGRTFVPSGRSLDGDVAVLGGPVELEGRVAGDLIVINGDLVLAPTARVDGDVTVVGGRIREADGAQVLGSLVAYGEVLVVQRAGDRLLLVSVEAERRRPGFRLPFYTLGSSDLLIASGTYNRVEGLPIFLGPRVITGGSNPLRLEFLGVYRSESGFRLAGDELGYRLRARQYLGGHRSLWFEASLHSAIEPIELRGLTNLESGLSTFVLHRDYRDHYERRGWSAALAWHEEGRPWDLRLEYRDERHASVAVDDPPADPWTLVENDEPFRSNARIHGGELRSLLLGLNYDTRNDPDRPWTGWWIRSSYELAVGGRLTDLRPDFLHAVIDVRRYNRVSPSAGIDFRITAGGRLAGDFLPAQRQHALGAEGSLPGYGRFQFDCGWRSGGASALVGIVPGYGCGRFALFQAQYRGSPRFRIGWGGDSDEPGPDLFRLRLEPALVVFYDVGTAWNGEGFFDHLTKSNNWVADVGLGVEFGGPGIYVAIPFREGAKGSNLFVRLARRI